MSFPHGPEFPALGTITRARRSRGHPRPSCLLPTERGRGRECGEGGRNWPLPGGLGVRGSWAWPPRGLRPQRTLRTESHSQGGFNQNKSGAGPVKQERKEARNGHQSLATSLLLWPPLTHPRPVQGPGREGALLEGALADPRRDRPQLPQPPIGRHLPPPLLPDPWALAGVGDYLRLLCIRWGAGTGVPGRGHTQALILWGGQP